MNIYTCWRRTTDSKEEVYYRRNLITGLVKFAAAGRQASVDCNLQRQYPDCILCETIEQEEKMLLLI